MLDARGRTRRAGVTEIVYEILWCTINMEYKQPGEQDAIRKNSKRLRNKLCLH